ncbi:hypothetical protein QUB80_15575 [Chlorogloeopsis sp. ULAP01]|uniref:hypothetical protein n=1 Tax=Chlorogloeopsis sp. ULAP01 TaxID=3056483 RepID=UPI0025AA99AE|nr:hypothetical protein [Chlorogloeopsis sp. ULAP01]MDM9382122.1 hypothetical protein [Chlorogloeopsis sp. ULAP01]
MVSHCGGEPALLAGFPPQVIPFHFLSDSYSTPPNLPLVRGGAVGGGVHPYQPFREIV